MHALLQTSCFGYTINIGGYVLLKGYSVYFCGVETKATLFELSVRGTACNHNY